MARRVFFLRGRRQGPTRMARRMEHHRVCLRSGRSADPWGSLNRSLPSPQISLASLPVISPSLRRQGCNVRPCHGHRFRRSAIELRPSLVHNLLLQARRRRPHSHSASDPASLRQRCFPGTALSTPPHPRSKLAMAFPSRFSALCHRPGRAMPAHQVHEID